MEDTVGCPGLRGEGARHSSREWDPVVVGQGRLVCRAVGHHHRHTQAPELGGKDRKDPLPEAFRP